MGDNMVMRRNPNMVKRIIGDETILVPIYKTSKEINCIYTLNKSASRIWEMLDEKKSILEIKKQVLEEFDIIPEEADKILGKFFKELEEIEAVSLKGGEK
jgi:hypothetical protein